MDKKELKKLSKQELERELVSLQEGLRSLRFKIASNQLKQVHEVKSNKKMIAFIKTLINSK